MKIKFGAIVTDGRGKLGGHVFSKNRAGSYVRTKVTPSNPQTAAQSIVRSLFGTISAGWSALTQSVRDSWDGAVGDWQKTDIFGDIKNPTGKSLYQRLNNQAQVVGYSAIATPPVKLAMVSGQVTACTVNSISGSIILTGAYAGADARVVLLGTSPQSAGTKFVKNKLRQIVAPLANAYSDTDAFDTYEAKFGTPAAGQNIYFGIKYILPSGQSSPVQTIKANVS
tara:strand:- start:12 stop:686 length:675 start_codon:yes stop_codon:yes gene_type:complete